MPRCGKAFHTFVASNKRSENAVSFDAVQASVPQLWESAGWNGSAMSQSFLFFIGIPSTDHDRQRREEPFARGLYRL
jgi:hypothetical protein